MYTHGQTAAGVTVPDTKLARDATELVRDATTDLIYNHCAPRGASLYSRLSRDGLGGRSVGLMALPESER
jgi:hypothetical protein